MSPSQATLRSVPQLKNPPINEVVCGVIFEPMQKLSLFQHGVYWAQRADDYPEFEVKPPIGDPGSIIELVGESAFRSWFISKDGCNLIQMQFDRFFANWRKLKPSDAYPRFSNRPDAPEGMLKRLLREFELFKTFSETGGMPLVVKAVELTKIDLLVEGRHWKDGQDLCSLFPLVESSYSPESGVMPKAYLFKTETERNGMVVRTTAANGVEISTGSNVVRVETTARFADLSNGIETALISANTVVNDVFAHLVDLERFEKVP